MKKWYLLYVLQCSHAKMGVHQCLCLMSTFVVLNWFWETGNILIFSTKSQLKECAGSWMPSWWKTRNPLFRRVNILAVDDLATCVTKAATALGLTKSSLKILVSAPRWFNTFTKLCYLSANEICIISTCMCLTLIKILVWKFKFVSATTKLRFLICRACAHYTFWPSVIKLGVHV